ncbi:kinesin-like protein kif22 [Vairimorpha apis BRL 01]|uniref:Kinesin-like protein kif22 n=1 Tax=Vairimorpha apis BRL 01 TaxID=1037528 RepID=T0L811_9MICR|nr:kinesin-like protein kif22 [Vairimorpha apis BRL 01]
MIGTKKSPGLIYNILKDLLADLEIDISYLEIYNEKIYDLLEPKQLFLRERENTVFVPDLFNKKITNYSEFIDVFEKGNLNRRTGETKLNKFSSRSHSILRLMNKNTKFYLVDLAGSENNRKTGNTGIRLTESNNINKSLFVLGNVVNSILRNDIRIPYRDSKLTRLLQDSIGGNSLCYVIANIIDDVNYLDETLNTLKFACKSRKIVNVPRTETININQKFDNSNKNKNESHNKNINKIMLDNYNNKNVTKLKFNEKNINKINVTDKNILTDKTNTPKKQN